MFPQHLLLNLFFAIWCVIFASDATAHEFWIDAEHYQVAEGDQIRAHLRNGEEFKGISLAYIDRRIARFDLAHNDALIPVTARAGDSPALNVAAPGAGLVIVVHETQPSFVTYKSWEKFDKFARHKAFGDWRAEHAARAYPDPPFKERYTRHAKALIAVGDGRGADRALGLKTEFVALTNPYDPEFDGTMRVQVLGDGRPRPSAQVEVFAQSPEGEVEIALFTTDADGIAAVPVTPGHRYLFDAVILAPIAAGEDAVWDTFWAALTFAVP